MLRVLAILLLVGALARPTYRGSWLSAESRQKTAAALLIDDSTSVTYRFGGRSRLDKAKAWARQLVRDEARFPRGSTFLVMTCGPYPFDMQWHKDRQEVLRRIHRISPGGHDAVLIVDEAQDMPTATLEMTRLLSNLETDSQKLLQIVLVGQPELREKLAKPNLRQLAQRITVRYHLGKMSRAETEQYLRHRLSVAGSAEASAIRFDPGAVREIYRYSHGTPRLVNAIGDKALLAGYVYRTGDISKYIVRLAARELKEAG